MMKKIVLALLGLGILAPILAQSQPWAAVSDGRRNYTLTLGNGDCPKLELAGMNNSDSTDMQGNPTGALQQMPALTAQLQEQIVVLEAQLKTMKPDDPSRPGLEAGLKQLRDALANMPKPPAPPKPLSLEQTLVKLRKDLSLQIGSGSLPALEKSAEASSAGLASRTALVALWYGKPAASLGLLLRAAKLEPRNAAHLVNLSALALYFGLHREALVLIAGAEKIGGKLEAGVLQANKGHALLRLMRYAEAEKVLRVAVTANPNLSEARMNLAVAISMQNKSRCQEALEWENKAWWRSDYADANQSQMRPLEQKFLTSDNSTPIPDVVPLVLASFNGKLVSSPDFYNQFLFPARTASRKQLEVIKKVPFISELRDLWLEKNLVEVLDVADSGATGALFSALEKQRFDDLKKTYRSPISNPENCQNAAQNLEQQDRLVRAAYQVSYRNGFAAAARISDKTYRYWAQLQLINIVFSASRMVVEIAKTAEYDWQNCTVKANLEPIGMGTMPAIPNACAPKAASAAPKQGLAMTISCDQITLNFNPPSWLSKFQVRRDSTAIFDSSSFDLRLTGISNKGFASINAKGQIFDVGGTRASAGKDWRYSFDTSLTAPIWFVSMERGAGR
jgi:tetratricopeptide (TPR) repeat protein